MYDTLSKIICAFSIAVLFYVGHRTRNTGNARRRLLIIKKFLWGALLGKYWRAITYPNAYEKNQIKLGRDVVLHLLLKLLLISCNWKSREANA